MIQILETYVEFSKISELRNNKTKTIYGSRFSSEDRRIKSLSRNLISEHEADRANIRFSGNRIKLLGGTLTLGIDEANKKEGFISSEMSERFLKIKA